MNAPKATKLSVVILNHNSGSMLSDCLDSLFANDLPQPSEVIIPDNASSDNSLELARQKWDERICILHNGANRGFSWVITKGSLSRAAFMSAFSTQTPLSIPVRSGRWFASWMSIRLRLASVRRS